jgi:hypothetical protein
LLSGVPTGWLGAYYAANLLVPVGMVVAVGFWGALLATVVVLGGFWGVALWRAREGRRRSESSEAAEVVS